METSLNTSKSRKKYYLLAFVLGCLPFLLSALSFMIRNNGIFYYYGDFNNQQMVFTNCISKRLSSFEFPQFDFNYGTGLDYINAYSYYGLFSPFSVIYFFIPYKFTLYAIPYVMALKFGVASLAAYIYISRFCKRYESALTGALLYAYSGAVLVNLVLPFLDAMALFPFLLAALESAVKDKRRGVFGAAVFICAITQYYIFGMEAVFLIIYFLVRLTDKSFRINIKDFFCLAIETILGLAASGIAFIPAVIYMLNSPRLGEPFGNIKDMLLYDSPWRYPRLIQSIFMAPELQGYANIFPDSLGNKYPFGSLWSSQGMYLPMFGVSGVVAYIAANKKSSFSKLFVLLIIITLIPVLNSIFSMGSSIYYARWMFMATLIMSAMTACAIEDDTAHFKAGIITEAAVMLLIMIFCIIFPAEKISYWTIGCYNYTHLWINIIITFAGIFTVFIMVSKAKSNSSYPAMVLTLASAFAFICSEAILFTGISDIRRPQMFAVPYTDEKEYPQIEDTVYGSRISMHTDFDNFNLLWEKGSPYCFTSIYEPYVYEYCNAVNTDYGSLNENYTTVCLTSVKERISYEPQGSAPSYPGDYFERTGSDGFYAYYENENFIPMGFCYEYCISEEDYLALDKDIRRSLMMKVMAVDDVSAVSGYLEPIPEEEIYAMDDEEFAEECAKRAEKTALSYYTDDDSYNAEIDLAEPELVFFSVAYDEGFTAYVDGEEVPLYNANFGFQAIPVPAGKHTIKCVYHSKWRDIGTVSSIIGISGLIIYTAVCFVIKKRKK